MPSIAARAAAVKQRQKIAHASSYWQRYDDSVHKDEKGNPHTATINTDKQTCNNCDFTAYYGFLRCPECNKMEGN